MGVVDVSRVARRARGAFFTPPELVRRLVALALVPRLRRCAWRSDGTPELRILDPACGDGRLLAAAAEAIASVRGGDPQAIARRCLVGYERDPATAARARATGARIACAEALFGCEAGAWDVILGNPPYLGSSELAAQDPELHARVSQLASCSHGEWDLSCAFIERTLDWLAEGGEAALVVPSRFLTSRAAAPLRHLLAERGAVRTIEHAGAAQHFAGATAYVCVLALGRARAQAVTLERGGDRHAMATSELGAAPWTGLLAGELGRLAHLPRLGQLARVAKGAGSNADQVFLVTADSALGKGRACRVRAARGRDVRSYALLHAVDAILPYDREGQLLPLHQLPADVARHLSRHRARLEARERGRFTGLKAHAWGRPQNLAWLRDRAPKVVMPDAAAEGRAALDERGTLVLDSAYAARPLDDVLPLGLLLAVLNSPMVARWLGATGMPLRGGYFRMKTDGLASLPVPDPTTRGAREVARRALAGQTGDLAERVIALYQG